MIALIVAGVVIGVNNSRGEDGGETETTSSEEKKDEGQPAVVTEEMSEEEKAEAAAEERRQTLQYSGENANKSANLTGVVTYASVSNGVLVIRTSIDQYLTAGTCELTLDRGGAIIYSDTANIVGGASTATCQGFDVAASELGGGNVDIIVNITADGKSGVIRGEANV